MAKISGNNNDNTLTGTNRSERIYGRGGDDTINAGGGNDRISGVLEMILLMEALDMTEFGVVPEMMRLMVVLVTII